VEDQAMMGIKDRRFKTHAQINLDQLVPAQHFYRTLERTLDLSFVRPWVEAFYTPFGRPSIDPVVFFKLQLIMLFEGIRSERLLMEQASLQLAWRWYLGYDLDETLPDHSSLTKIRERYGLPIFRRFFEHIVTLCAQAGLIWGDEVYFDGTRIQANADLFSNVSNLEYRWRQQLKSLFASDTSTEPSPPMEPRPDFMEGWVASYRAKESWLKKPKLTAYQPLATRKTSLTDADATPLHGKKEIGYHMHYMVDGGSQRIILGVLVTPADVLDHTPMLDLLRWGRFRWQIHPRAAVGDSRYGTVENIVGLWNDRILPYTPRAEFRKLGQYSYEAFRYDAAQDVYYCPEGQMLKRGALDRDHRSIIYQAGVRACRACRVRHLCTNAKQKGRRISRSYDQEALDRAAALRTTPAFMKALRKRSVWVEPLFGEAKQWHGLSRFRLRRLWRVNIQALLVASVQNLKRLLKHRVPQPPLSPRGGGARVGILSRINVPSFRFEVLILSSSILMLRTFSTGWARSRTHHPSAAG
jgi:transposase